MTPEELSKFIQEDKLWNPIIEFEDITEEEKKYYSQLIFFVPPWVKTIDDWHKYTQHLNFRLHETRYRLAGLHEDAVKIEKFYNSGERL